MFFSGGRGVLMVRVVFPCLVIMLAFSCCCLFVAEADVFYSEGKAPVIAGKKFPAQRFAHMKAFNKAVSLALESLVVKGSAGVEPAKSEILKGPFSFVDKEELVERTIDSKGVMKIGLKLYIDMKKLSERLGQEGLLVGKHGSFHPELSPKLIVVIGEEVDGKVSKAPYSSQVMHDFLQERDFDVLLDEIIKDDLKNELAIEGMLRGDTRAALKLAVNVGAVIVVSGKLSLSSSRARKGDMVSYSSRVSLQAINADSGRIIASVKNRSRHSCSSSARGVRECIARATRKTGSQLVLAIEKEFRGKMGFSTTTSGKTGVSGKSQ